MDNSITDVRSETALQETSKKETSKEDTPKIETPKKETLKQEAPKHEISKDETSKIIESPKPETPKDESPNNEPTEDETPTEKKKSIMSWSSDANEYLIVAIAETIKENKYNDFWEKVAKKFGPETKSVVLLRHISKIKRTRLNTGIIVPPGPYVNSAAVAAREEKAKADKAKADKAKANKAKANKAKANKAKANKAKANKAKADKAQAAKAQAASEARPDNNPKRQATNRPKRYREDSSENESDYDPAKGTPEASYTPKSTGRKKTEPTKKAQKISLRKETGIDHEEGEPGGSGDVKPSLVVRLKVPFLKYVTNQQGVEVGGASPDEVFYLAKKHPAYNSEKPAVLTQAENTGIEQSNENTIDFDGLIDYSGQQGQMQTTTSSMNEDSRVSGNCDLQPAQSDHMGSEHNFDINFNLMNDPTLAPSLSAAEIYGSDFDSQLPSSFMDTNEPWDSSMTDDSWMGPDWIDSLAWY